MIRPYPTVTKALLMSLLCKDKTDLSTEQRQHVAACIRATPAASDAERKLLEQAAQWMAQRPDYALTYVEHRQRRSFIRRRRRRAAR